MQDDSKSMPPGWWIVPGSVLGALSWAVIIRTVRRGSLSSHGLCDWRTVRGVVSRMANSNRTGREPAGRASVEPVEPTIPRHEGGHPLRHSG